MRPDLQIVGIRGNVNTRLEKLRTQNIDGLVLASAGLKRLGLEDEITEYFDETQMIPACGQGILALQVLKDSPLLEMLEAIGDEQANQRMKLESLFLAQVNGGCHIPVGSYAKQEGNLIHFYAVLGNEDGSKLIKKDEVFSLDEGEEKVKEIARKLKEEVYGR